MTPAAVRVGTRGSRLALAQIEIIRPLLQNIGLELDPVVIRTSGDRGERERVGAFVGEIQSAVQSGLVDIGLHCLKDLPVREVDGLRLVAYLEREDPSEVLISRFGPLVELPEVSLVGTGSVRRTTQLAAVRPDLQFRPLVGNVDTRIGRLRSGEYDAIVLARAGLARLGLFPDWPYSDLSVEVLPFEQVIPAPGQGVLVLEMRSDHPMTDKVGRLNHLPTEAAARAERAFLAAFGGGCSVPIGAIAEGLDDLHLRGVVWTASIRLTGSTSDPEGLGRAAAQMLKDRGVTYP